MDLTTEGRYRVLGRPREPDELLLVERDAPDAAGSDRDDGDDALDGGATAGDERADGDGGGATAGDGAGDADAFAPTYVDAAGYEDGHPVETLEAGNLVDARLSWRDGDPRFERVEVVAETTFTFVDGVTGIFEAAKRAWMVAEAENEGMNASVTRDTDGDPNGALYVFAKQSGARDLFAEFRDGVTPLDPLLDRVDRGESDRVDVPPETERPRAVFVLRPREDPFLVVYIVFDRDGTLARTVRETYV